MADWGKKPALPNHKRMDTQIDMNLYMDTDTNSSLWNTALPQPFASSCYTRRYQTPAQ